MDISDIRIFNKFKDLESLSSEDSNDIDKQRACMVRNLDKNEEFRKEVWKRLYGSKFKRNQAVINQAEQEWAEMDQEKKKEWSEFVYTEMKAGFIEDLTFITHSLKENKGNVKRVWKELKEYGEQKKEDANNRNH